MSDTPLSGDRLNEERAFVKRYTDGLASRPVEYRGDFSTPLEDRPRKVAVVGVEVAEPPTGEEMDVDAPQDSSISIVVKSLKPSLTLNLTAQLTDTISDLKEQIVKSSNTAPSVEQQRLLFKGKALVDTKLLKEYDIPDGATIHLMIRAPASTPASIAPSTSEATLPNPTSSSAKDAAGPSPPSLTITTSIDADSTAGTSQPLTLGEQAGPPLGPQPSVSTATYHRTLADPQFWQKIHALCVSEFAFEEEADAAWETFLIAMKGKLSAGEAAKIRDVVGVTGMGSTA